MTARGPLRTLAEAVAQDVVVRAVLKSHIAQSQTLEVDANQAPSRITNAAAVSRLTIEGLPGRLYLLVGDQGAAALVRLTMPVDSERSPQRVADALRAFSERTAEVVGRMLASRTDGRVHVRLLGEDVQDDTAMAVADREPWLGHRVRLTSDGLADIDLTLLCTRGVAVGICERWRTGIVSGPNVGTVLSFVSDPGVTEILRRASKAVGLDMHDSAPGEAPNPSAIDASVVVLDIPVGQERRYDWCARLKLRRPEIPVLLVVHHPSKVRVLRGCLTRADALVGWPATETQVADRLVEIMSREPPRDGPPVD
ncbi:MAG: hypothetical protein IPM29_27675 [Planctomycetes bacterium]|nr:hypothetical protein [Planctomycetota bacterium]